MSKRGVVMELSERKRQILAAIVKAYIISGEPIGSKMLCDILENAPSSATLRNEMSSLCNMGFLEQPHTSAGRVPTPSAYRLYVEDMMPKGEISQGDKETIDAALSNSNCDPEHLPETAAKLLSDLTGLPVVAANISKYGPTIKKVEYMRLGLHSLMLFVVTSDGRTRSRLCHIEKGCDSLDFTLFDKILCDKILDKSAKSLSPAAMQSIFVSAGSGAFPLMPLFAFLFDMISDISKSDINIVGTSNIYAFCPARDDANKMLSLLTKRDTVLEIISKSDANVGIVLGAETPYSALNNSSVVFAKYGSNDYMGSLCIIGPTRMSYEHILPCIRYAALRLSERLAVSLKDMEEHLNV